MVQEQIDLDLGCLRAHQHRRWLFGLLWIIFGSLAVSILTMTIATWVFSWGGPGLDASGSVFDIFTAPKQIFEAVDTESLGAEGLGKVLMTGAAAFGGGLAVGSIMTTIVCTIRGDKAKREDGKYNISKPLYFIGWTIFIFGLFTGLVASVGACLGRSATGIAGLTLIIAPSFTLISVGLVYCFDNMSKDNGQQSEGFLGTKSHLFGFKLTETADPPKRSKNTNTANNAAQTKSDQRRYRQDAEPPAYHNQMPGSQKPLSADGPLGATKYDPKEAPPPYKSHLAGQRPLGKSGQRLRRMLMLL